MARSVDASPACTRVPAAPIAGAPGCARFDMIDCGSALVSGRWPSACSTDRDHPREGACVRRCRREGGRCEKTEAAIEAPIAAPAWPRYGTRLPLRHLCVLLAVRAAGVGFRRRRGALCGQLHLGSGFLADRRSATTHLAIYHRPSYERQGSSQIPGNSAAHVPCATFWPCACGRIVMLSDRYLDNSVESTYI